MKGFTFTWIRFLILFLILLALGGLQACFTGSETGNPTRGATGVLLSVQGKPAPHTRVYLLPSNFNPLDLLNQKASLVADTTDPAGRFSFTGVDSGLYNLEALDLGSGARAFHANVRITHGVVELGSDTLHNPGKITMVLQGAVDTTDGYVYVTGTTLFKKVSSENGNLSFDSVPAGKVDSLQYGNPGHTVGPITFAWNLNVESDSTLAVPAPFLSWIHTRIILLDTRGIGVTSVVTRFPLLVRLSSSNFDFSSARNDGSDLRFTNAAGQPLPCEIQQWDSAAGIAAAWVLVDSVFGDSLQPLHLYWGKSDSVAPVPVGSVFDIADGYAGVWHLDEDAHGAAPQFRDASGRNNPGTALGYSAPAGVVSGLVGSGMALDGISQFAGTQQSFNNPQVFTLSAWFRTTTMSGGKILDFTDMDTSTTTAYRDRHIFMTTNGTVHFSVYPPSAANQDNPNPGIYKTIDSPKPLNDGQWHQVAARLSSGGQDLFVDGVLVASDPASTVAENITGFWRWGYGSLTGWAPPGTSFYFQGTLDEIWITHAARSDDFIKLSFENQKANSQLLLFP